MAPGVPHDTREQIVDFIQRWSEKTEIGIGRFTEWLNITTSKFYDWRERYGKVNEHNGWVPRDFWLENWEKHLQHSGRLHPIHRDRLAQPSAKARPHSGGRPASLILSAQLQEMRRNIGVPPAGRSGAVASDETIGSRVFAIIPGICPGDGEWISFCGCLRRETERPKGAQIVERQQRIETLFAGALQQPAAERDIWLRQACGSDPDLLREVGSLIAHHRDEGPESWAAAAAAELLTISGGGIKPGTRIGVYEILEPIGVGGMGEVYRARDGRLQREVAIKVLPDAFAQDPDRLARFTREARVLASLNHPNIAAIYGVEERALVMELVEGPTLADRIRQGALPVNEALGIARQMAEALEAAHEKGKVHRDLKPANIKITPGGSVKVLDFGLAKTMEEPSGSEPSNSPTMTISPTRAGLILGTASYMAPEQARGQTVDKRADIWAFGCVLFEMLTGKPVFKGDSTSDILAAVIKEEPTLEAIPQHLRPILAKCLRKDPHLRWRDIGDVRLALEESSPVAVGPVHRRSLLPWVVAGVLAIALVVAGLKLSRLARPVQHSPMQLRVELAPSIDLNGGATVVVSPDGTRLVFPSRGADGKRRLGTRLLSQLQSTPLPGTEDMQAPANAFFSPDGEWIGFFAQGKLQKIPPQGGAPVVICDVRSNRGGSWGDDGNIVFAPATSGGLVRVSANGGIPQPLTELKAGEVTHRWPQVLPGSRYVLFTANTGPNWENASIEIQSLKTGQRKTLHKGGSYGRYIPTGHLVYVHESTLYAASFDLDRQELTGLPTPILGDVTNSAVTGSAQFDFSAGPAGHGSLIYLTGKGPQTVIYSLDSAGNTHPLHTTAGNYQSLRFSPDGKRLALSSFSGDTGLWILDLERDNLLRLTSTPGDNLPVWSRDGRHIAYQNSQTGLFLVRSDASSPPEQLLKSEHPVFPGSFSPDGKRLAYAEANPETGTDIWTVRLEGSDADHPMAGQPEPFLRTAANEFDPAFSPDGRWMAYTSDDSGNFEVYVRPFPGPGAKWRISTETGRIPVWSKSGRVLAYETLDGRLMIVPYGVKGDSFTPGKPRLWSSLAPEIGNTMDLAPDGKRFAVLMPQQSSTGPNSPGGVSLLLNFFDDLKQRVPPGGR